MGKHKKKHKNEAPNAEEIINETKNDIGSVHKKKKKKKHKKEEEDDLEIGAIGDETKLNESPDKAADISIHHNKKKKKKKDNDEESNVQITDKSQSMNSNKRKWEEEINENSTDEVPKKKKKKRKHKEEKESSLNHDTVENAVMEKNENVKHNKKKKNRKEKFELENGNDVETKNENRFEETQLKEKKKKHKTKKKESSAHNNTDEKDTEKEMVQTGSKFSEPSVGKEQPVETGFTGQWNSASLGDTDRQNKFLRLLGGFKKGSDASGIKNKFVLGGKANPNKSILFNKPGDSDRKLKFGGNVAMDKKQEEIYKKSMENEYERAMSMNLNRGVGLGFRKPPEEGKKFYIDMKKSNSIKFDA